MEFGSDLSNIIYRGLSIGSSVWVYGYLLVRKDRYYIATRDALDFIVVSDNKATLNLIEVDPDTVGIYSHFHDCNDIKVFTGDVLETIVGERISPFSHEIRTLVIYNEGIGFYANGFCDIAPFEFRFCKIVGNIHENPELLEGIALSFPEEEEDDDIAELDEFIERMKTEIEEK